MENKTTTSEQTNDSTTHNPAKTANAGDLGQAEVQEKMDKETDRGYRGVAVDPTPNENYTVSGVTSGKPTPETDPKAAQKAREVTGGAPTAVERNVHKSGRS